MRTIGDSAFGWCGSLASINLPEYLKTLEKCAFYGCESLKNVQLPDGLEMIGRSCFGNCCLEEVAFPASVKTVGAGAFQECG